MIIHKDNINHVLRFVHDKGISYIQYSTDRNTFILIRDIKHLLDKVKWKDTDVNFVSEYFLEITGMDISQYPFLSVEFTKEEMKPSYDNYFEEKSREFMDDKVIRDFIKYTLEAVEDILEETGGND